MERGDRILRLRQALVRGAFLYLAVKTAVACGAAWVVASELLSAPAPVLAPLGALITLQSTVFATITAAVQRVAGVAAGVGIALAAGSLTGLNWSSIVLVVLGGLVVGRVLRLDAHAIEVPISALFVLVVGAVASDYSFERVLTMLVGAAVGVLAHLVLLPPVAVRPAADALSLLGCSAACLLADIAECGGPWGQAEAQAWLRRGRRLPALAADALAAVEAAEESARFNPLASRSATALQRLRHGLAATEHAASQTRGVTRTLADIAATRTTQEPLSLELRAMLAQVASTLDSFTMLVVSEGSALEGLRRQRVSALEAHDAAAAALQRTTGTPRLWALRGALLVDLQAILSEVSPDGAHAAALLPSTTGSAGP